eukprot:3079699-Pleurochrysis_carterae.AAC.1
MTLPQTRTASNNSKASPADNVGMPPPADKSDDLPPADGSLGPESSAQTPTDEPGFEVHFHLVRMCQTPEVCRILPPEATSALELPSRTCIEEECDTITATALLRLLLHVDQAEDYAARADQITSRFTRL